MKIIILVVCCLSTCLALKVKSKTVDKNAELFEFSEHDEYTLPKDIDDEKPPVVFNGDEMMALILSLENKNHGKGKFKYRLQTQNGIELTQVGKLKDEKTFVISGSYSYTGADGKRYRVRYTADEFGYHPITELDFDLPDLDPAKLKMSPGLAFLAARLNRDSNSNSKNHGNNGNGKGNGNGYGNGYGNGNGNGNLNGNNGNNYGNGDRGYGKPNNDPNNPNGGFGPNGPNGQNGYSYKPETDAGVFDEKNGYVYGKPLEQLDDNPYLPPFFSNTYLPPVQ